MNTGNPHSENQAWTIGRLITSAADYLGGKDVGEPRLGAEILLASALKTSRLALYTRWTEPVDDQARGQFREMIRRAADDEPVAYIVGHKEFFSLDFEVGPGVLIPRPETELLVERALSWIREHPRETWQVFEAGTGTGCIGAALLKNAPTARLLACDRSEKAVAVAQRNFEKLGLAERATVIEADWMLLPDDTVPEGGFDLIVTNPPYVATTETDIVGPDVLAHEPHEALFAGVDGLDFYRRTVAEAPPLLNKDATLFCEVGWKQADKVVDLFTAAGWQVIGRWKDFAGIERTLQFARPG